LQMVTIRRAAAGAGLEAMSMPSLLIDGRR
jgi:hypothetical protein